MLTHAFNDLPTDVISKNQPIPSRPTSYSGNLVIEQDVEDSHLTARGNIHIYGQVQNSCICSQEGTVFLELGAFAKSRISAGVNVYTRHANHSTIDAKKDVITEASMTWCKVKAGRCIFVERQNGRIANCTLAANAGMFLGVVGGVSDASQTNLHIERANGFIRFAELHPNVLLEIHNFKRKVTECHFVGSAEVKANRLVVNCKSSMQSSLLDENKQKIEEKITEEEVPEPDLVVSIEKSPATCTVKLTGKLYSNTVEQFDRSCLKIASADQDLLFDFSELTFISSAGLRSILTLWKNRRNKKFAIYGAQPFISDVFKMSGFTSYIQFFETRDEAFLDSFGG